MTLRDLERMVYRRLSKSLAIPNPETQARIRGFLNERHRRILTDHPQLRDDVLSFSSVASQFDYALPEQGIARINRIWDPSNQRYLGQRDLHWLRTHDPDPQEGTPVYWIPMSYTQVHTQPSGASEVFVDSDSASDTNRCYVEGIISGGYRRKAEVTMTGTTAVSLSSSITTWIQIDKFYLSEEAVGTVTLHEDASGGTELSRIAIGDTYAKFLTFTLWPTPSAVVAYDIDVTRGIGDMRHPLDEPLLPDDFHDLLAIGARLDEYEHTDDSRRRMAEVEWDERSKALVQWMRSHPSSRIDLNRDATTHESSRLGAWYPSDWLEG